jgi:hypothetical protein
LSLLQEIQKDIQSKLSVFSVPKIRSGGGEMYEIILESGTIITVPDAWTDGGALKIKFDDGTYVSLAPGVWKAYRSLDKEDDG